MGSKIKNSFVTRQDVMSAFKYSFRDPQFDFYKFLEKAEFSLGISAKEPVPDKIADELWDVYNAAAKNEPFTDFLSPVLSEFSSKYDNKSRGYFPTPIAICDLIAQMNLHDINFDDYHPIHRPFMVSDPCAGCGAMPLSLIKFIRPQDIAKVHIYCVEINITTARLCAIQLRMAMEFGQKLIGRIVVIQGNALVPTDENPILDCGFYHAARSMFCGEAQAEKQSEALEFA
jgi:type I restriction-modification system DNA methylase subunit